MGEDPAWFPPELTRRQVIRMLGNGVVREQAAAAFEELLDGLDFRPGTRE